MAWNGSAGTAVRNAGSGVKRPRTRGVLVGAMAVILAAAAWFGVKSFAVRDSDDDAPKASRLHRADRKPRKGAGESVRAALPDKLPRRRRLERHPAHDRDLFAHLTGADRKMAEAVQAALDDGDCRKTAAAAMKAMASTNAEVRLNAVEALGWFGAEALPEITEAMLDPDEDVRQAAANRFEQALDEFEKPGERFKIAMAAFGTLTDEDQLQSLGGIVNNAATELIDGEEDADRQFEKRVSVIQSLVDVIEGGNDIKNAEAAAEAFSMITGNEWQGIEEAERYLQDPDNYEPLQPPEEQTQQSDETDPGQPEGASEDDDAASANPS